MYATMRPSIPDTCHTVTLTHREVCTQFNGLRASYRRHELPVDLVCARVSMTSAALLSTHFPGVSRRLEWTEYVTYVQKYLEAFILHDTTSARHRSH